MDYKSITEINELVKSILESEPILSDIYVKVRLVTLNIIQEGTCIFL